MRRLTDSLYARLVLVLLIALAASYATMYELFLSRMEESRVANIARLVAGQVRLTEDLIRDRSPAELSKLNGIRFAARPPQASADATAVVGASLLPRLQEHLRDELGRPVVLVPSAEPDRGYWVELKAPGGASPWLFMPAPKPRSQRSDSLITALIVGFAVFLGGGMLVLWQIQRPLKRLGGALAAVGHTYPMQRLPVTGAAETRTLAEHFNAMVERLERFEEDRATMLAGVTHDLRTPLTRLRLLAELDRGPRTGEMLKNVDDIERITEQFLAYARGAGDETPEEHDVPLFVAEVAAPYAERGVTTAGGDGLTWPIRACALRRALVNLIENAVEYGDTPVSVGVAVENGELVIAVDDHGTGIPENEIERARRPFARIDPSRGGKGHCGLGLVIAARIAEEHGGSLVIANRSGGGLHAEIRLPSLPPALRGELSPHHTQN